MKSLEKNITVLVDQGVHGRVAARLAQIVQQHNVELFILDNEEEIDCSSVLNVLSMGFVSGTVVKFRVQGEKAVHAISAVEELLATREEP